MAEGVTVDIEIVDETILNQVRGDEAVLVALLDRDVVNRLTGLPLNSIEVNVGDSHGLAIPAVVEDRASAIELALAAVE
ncbi:hypothetical protein [Halalkalicoccus salilacus]|uniref:hypothetical protein n=1 Tax=Halalkalicoccus TaxID=332246 RepID=UPI002F96413B